MVRIATRNRKLLQLFALFGRKLFGYFDADFYKLVTPITTAQAGHPITAQAEGCTILRTGRYLYRSAPGLVPKRRHFYAATKRGKRKLNRYLTMEIVTTALKQLVLLYGNIDIEIARFATMRTRLPIATGAQPITIVYTGWNAEAYIAVLLDAARPFALTARLLYNHTGTMAGRAYLPDAEKAPRRLHLSMPVASIAANLFGTGLSPTSGTAGAAHGTAVENLLFNTARGLKKRDFKIIAKIITLLWSTTLPATATKKLFKNTATTTTACCLPKHLAKEIKWVIHACATPTTRACGASLLERRMAIAIIGRTLISIG